MQTDLVDRIQDLAVPDRNVSDVIGQLKSIDKYGLLGAQTTALARVIAISQELGMINPKLIEFGAIQHKNVGTYQYHPGISHFFAVHDDLGLDYAAFDPEYCPEAVFNESHKLVCNPNVVKGKETYDYAWNHPLVNSDMGLLTKLCDGIRRIPLLDYVAAEARVEETLKHGEIPVVFSNDVLNYPLLELKYPFWQLPGLHIHKCLLTEVCAERKIMPKIRLVPAQGSLSYMYDDGQNFLDAPKRHIKGFRKFIGADSAINYLFDPGSRHMTYIWMNPGHSYLGPTAELIK